MPGRGCVSCGSAVVAKLDESPWLSSGARRQQRSAKRDAVLRTAAHMFLQRGFQGTSLDDIAASLHVTKPTLYHYIANKEEILFACVHNGLVALQQGIAEATLRGLVGRERLQAAMQCYAEVATSDFGQCVIRIGEEPLSEERRQALRQLKGQIDAEFQALIAQGMDAGWIEPGDASMAAHSVVGALSGIGRWYQPGQHSAQALQVAVDHCIHTLMRGVLGPPQAAAQLVTAATVDAGAQRRELHFNDRVLRCLVQRPRNLAQMLAAALAQRPDGDALVCDGLRLSWRELHHAASRCAGGLVQRGVVAGDRVALFLPNSAEFVIVTLACAWLGAVLVPVNARAGSAELQWALVDSAAVAVVCAPALWPMLPPPEAAPGLRWRLASGAVPGDSVDTLAALMQAAPLVTPHDAAEEDLAAVLYTSGTTGEPRGAMLTQLNIAHSVATMGLDAEDRSAVAVPLSHVTGLVAQLYALLHCQGALVLLPEFKASAFVALVAAQRISHTIMVPAMYNLLLLLPELDPQALRSWRVAAFGGATMPTASIEELARRLPALVLMNAYGATETCSPATIMQAGHTAAHADSVGQAVACGDILVVDEAGCELPRGQVGEILVAGPMVVPGYWRNPAATAREFVGGHWRSGDIGLVDAQGYVRILDRKKDVINRGGYKVFSVAVENTLAQHPQVLESALVGVPCAVLGERVHAFVCVQALDERTQAQALQAFCAARLADYAVPETWTIGTAPLPRNANGKLMKRLLRETLQAALT